jgi:hypothetical protein
MQEQMRDLMAMQQLQVQARPKPPSE